MSPSRWPRRPRLVVGNWKMNKSAAEGATFARELVALMAARPGCEIVVCPPFTALEAVGAALRGSPLHWGAQNLHPEPCGAFTGEVSGTMLAALGCRFAIVGHSERRHGLGESDGLVALKLRAALRDGLTPIVCVGETLGEREASKTTEVLVRQVRAAFDGLAMEQAGRAVVAYEPVWAIGTGRVAEPAQASEAHTVIRATLDQVIGAGCGAEATILYGGSVGPATVDALFAEDEIDGGLVGGASLEAASFWKIAVAAARA